MRFLIFISVLCLTAGCQSDNGEEENNENITLLTLDPGHFHASLIQKNKLEGVDTNVYVYAPEGAELETHLALIKQFNNRVDNPTHWNEVVYTGNDFLEKMIQDKKGEVVILAGNNKNKTEYIQKSIEAGLHVLSDKPMAIDTEGFEVLLEAFQNAERNHLQLYDIMTERFNIYSVLQKELIHNDDIFGEIIEGSPDNPSVIKRSVHHFYKEVSGNPLIRPGWYYDVEQQGEGIVDVTTHFVDLIHWQCFPEQAINHTSDIALHSAKRWPTLISKSQFEKSTELDSIPEYLRKDWNDDNLNIYANGSMIYSVKDIFAEVEVEWDFEAEEGMGDTHFSQIKGTHSTISIRQDKEQDFQPKLYIEPVDGQAFSSLELEQIKKGFDSIEEKYPGVTLEESNFGLEVNVPENLIEGHEEHFSQVANRFFKYIEDGKMPDWEVTNTITKYYITTQALALAKETSP